MLFKYLLALVFVVFTSSSSFSLSKDSFSLLNSPSSSPAYTFQDILENIKKKNRGFCVYSYSEGSKKAVLENKNLITFIGCEPFKLDDYVIAYEEYLDGFKSRTAIVSSPDGKGWLYYVKTIEHPSKDSFKENDNFRNPIGHTHTCPKCGNVWDHQSNPGHNCDNCGTPQYYQDTQYKLVPLKKNKVELPILDNNCTSSG